MMHHISGSMLVDTNDTKRKRIPLFDGSFETGYVVRDFRIATDDPITNKEFQAKLTTDDAEDPVSTWNWGSNIEVGWACWGVPAGSRFAYFDHVDQTT